MAESIDLNAPEVQEAIKQAVKVGIAEATEPLVAKNKELLGELKTARKSSEIKPEDLERVEQERDEIKAQFDKVSKEFKETKKLAETSTKQFETETAFTKKLLIDNGLSDELVKAGVRDPIHLKAVKSMLAGQVAIEADGDNRVAKVGDKPLNEFVTEWATSDEGKAFITAPNNSGGGSNGGSNNNENKPTTSVGKIAAGLKARQT